MRAELVLRAPARQDLDTLSHCRHAEDRKRLTELHCGGKGIRKINTEMLAKLPNLEARARCACACPCPRLAQSPRRTLANA